MCLWEDEEETKRETDEEPRGCFYPREPYPKEIPQGGFKLFGYTFLSVLIFVVIIVIIDVLLAL